SQGGNGFFPQNNMSQAGVYYSLPIRAYVMTISATDAGGAAFRIGLQPVSETSFRFWAKSTVDTYFTYEGAFYWSAICLNIS
ncbi:hypothetical protein P9109_12235, partial [Gallibacterium anatis]|uniref:hypothetical protein n=1 Tax=Gallibacterium anatis TaxID=750 RepID=UPI003003CC41